MKGIASDRIRCFNQSLQHNNAAAQRYPISINTPAIGSKREKEIISHFATGAILDAGAGTGRISKYLKYQGKNVVALDLSLEMLIKQKELLPCIQGDIENLPFGEAAFDTVNATWVLLHFPDWKHILEELIRVLKPHGMLLFEVSSKEHLEWASKYISDLKIKYSSAEAFEVFISIEELSRFLNKRGMHIKQAIPYDHLNANELIQILVEKSSVDPNRLKELCNFNEVVNFWCWIEEQILSQFPIGLSHKNFIIAVKSGQIPSIKAPADSQWISPNEVINIIIKIFESNYDQFPSRFVDFFEDRNITAFYREITSVLHPIIDLDIITIIKKLTNHSMPLDLSRKIEKLSRNEFSYWAEHFVTSWYHNIEGKNNMSVNGVPIGPIAEYDLMKDIIVNCPEKIYLNEENKNERQNSF